MVQTTDDTAQLEIRISELRLKNFKGIRRFDLVLDGEDVTVRGDNATGKTTLADAISWLLFDKDSAGRSTFGIKTVDATGEAIHNLEHTVEATLLRNGSMVTLKKVLTEKWTRKRGQAAEEFTGHETQHFIDGVPRSKGDYTAYVETIAPESLVRMLTDPFHFPERIHWSERRTTLLDMCGDVSDEDVIASDPALKDLPEILGDYSMDDAKEVILARRKKINDELKAIPVRIDEARRGAPDVSGIDGAKTKARLAGLKAKRREAEEERVRIKAGGEIAERRRELAEARTRMQEIMREAASDADTGRDELRVHRNELRRKLDEVTLEKSRHESTIIRSEKEIESIDARLARMRVDWGQITARAFGHTADDTCPACGQALPADQVEAAHQKALEEFNARKARELEDLDTRGKSMREERNKLVEAVGTAQRAINHLEPDVDQLDQQIAELDEQLNAPVEQADPAQNADYQQAAAEAEKIKASITELESGTAEALSRVDERIDSLDADISKTEDQLTALRSAESATARVDELSSEERRLAGEFEEMERHLYLLDLFLRAKVSMLTERINSRFQTVRFRLFETQINQGLREVCEVSVGGVDWKDVNHGAQINAGLEIIDVLGEHYGLRLPILVDQAESVTRLRETVAQQIRLVVDAAARELTIDNTETPITSEARTAELAATN